MKHLLKAQDIAAILNISPQSVYKAARTGEFPAYRVGRSVRFDEKEVLNAVQRTRCLRSLREAHRV